ncbi:uncharacterized protein LOC118751104 [Rhagoletis pomonella]|uniref:uncharacterized protein LOC118751104 n=1 Tax=Rhagoletis pomonella TaxID=28610 RepID=UPI0017818C1B|nr:uncharacterized protein LOC118751104 [Rhagoletis pomonella]
MGTELNFRQLIDLAIGSPESGHVNFDALHLLLFSFAEKLNIIDDPVDNTKYENVSFVMSSGKFGSESYDHYQGAAVALGKGAFLKHTKHTLKRPGKYGVKNVKRSGKRQTGGADPEEPVAAEETEIEEVTEAQSNNDVPAEMLEEVPTSEQAPAVEEQPPAAEEQYPEIEGLTPVNEELPEMQQSKNTADLELQASEYKVDEAIEEVLELKASGEDLELVPQDAQQHIPDGMYRGIAIMKDQLELTMEQVRLLVLITLNKKSTALQLDKLRSLMTKMVAIQKENIYIEQAFGFRLSDIYYDPELEREDVEEEVEEESDVQSDPSYKPPLTSHTMEQPQPPPPRPEEYDLDAHLCYSPDKLLDQLLDLKSEFCLLTNKVNEISAKILQQDCQRTTMLIAELQEHMTDLKFYVSSVKEATDRLESKNMSNSDTIEELTKSLEDVMNEKIDKSEIEILLADKVDYNQLQRKASQEQMQELQCRLEKKFTEVHKQLKTNDKNMYQAMDNMRTSLGLASVDDVLNRFKEKLEAEIHGLQEKLKKYMDATNDECAAAGARIKVLQDLACISCDTTCVMRTMEKSKVAKLPNAHATNLLSPLITYEIGSIRKSGIMGYYRKDEFPHAPNAWLNQQKVAMKMCVPRHAGGAHTTHTAREHFEKVMVNKK